jgi:pseudouridine-5'-phosphate glycosidase/pseudouridine kinase
MIVVHFLHYISQNASLTLTLHVTISEVDSLYPMPVPAPLRTITRRFSSSVRTTKGLPHSLVSARERGVPIDVHPEVEQALLENQPLVALETAIVTHGIPYPINFETTASVEQYVRSAGAIPATIGIIKGRVKIGLDPAQLEHLADVRTNRESVKLSRRDLAAAMALKKDGGTTCSATLIFAALAGIKVSTNIHPFSD